MGWFPPTHVWLQRLIICLIIYRARCTLTDLDRLVPLLQESISLNGSLKDRVTAASLHWGDENHIKNFEINPPGIDDIKLFNIVSVEVTK